MENIFKKFSNLRRWIRVYICFIIPAVCAVIPIFFLKFLITYIIIGADVLFLLPVFIYSEEVKHDKEREENQKLIDQKITYYLMTINKKMPEANIDSLPKNIFELKPAHFAVYNTSGLHIKRYWKLKSEEHKDTFEETCENLKYLLEDAITRQLVSDVPLCTFLSGGLDSSIITKFASDYCKKEGLPPLNTYSIDYVDNDKNFVKSDFQPNSDNYYIELMNRNLHTNHHQIVIDTPELASYLEDAMLARDMPGMADIDSSLLLFCKNVKKEMTVSLTGECADEVFGGYPWFHKEEFLKSNTFPWTPDLSPRKELIKSDVLYALKMDEFVQKAYESTVSETALLPWEDETESNRRQIGYLNIRFFMQTLLNRMDRTSMNSGLEARVPFADRKLVEYVFNVPWNMKAYDGVVKNLLRQGARGKLPDEILFRRKSPYPKSYNPYYEKLLAERLEVLIEEGDSPLFKIIDIKKLKKFMQSVKDYGKPWYGQLMAGPQMLAYLVQLGYWMKKFQIKIEI